MILLLCFILTATVFGEEKVPDITLLSSVIKNTSFNNCTCVAGNNVDDSAITFMTPFPDDLNSESKYILEGKEISKDLEYDCNFETSNECKSKWINRDNDALEVESTMKTYRLLDPTLDERWESNQTNTQKPIDLSDDKFTIGLSIRTNTETSILFCNNVDRMQCHWIVLNSKSDSDKQILKYCNAKEKQIGFSFADNGCRDIDDTTTNTTLNEKKWIHITVSKTSNDFYTIKRLENNRIIDVINYNIPQNLTLKFMYVHMKEEQKGFWKIHDYSYLSLKQNFANGKWHDLGPKLKQTNNEICVTFYAATCKKCDLSFKFNDDQIYEVEESSKTHWKYFKLLQNFTSEKKELQLQVKATCLNCDKSEGFWYIDDVRRCHSNEKRIINIVTNKNNIISCVAVKEPDWYSSNNGGEIQFQTHKICTNSKFIGQYCNISCSSILGDTKNNEYCNKHKICKPSKNDLSECSCASGYYNKRCNTPCAQGFYGYNCVNVCPSCKDNSCLKSEGTCSMKQKCTENDSNTGCNKPEILQLLKPPRIINATLTTITVQPEINQRSSANQNVKYQIEYKTEKESKWTSHEEEKEITQLQVTTISNLKPKTKYKVRMVLYSKDGQDSTTYNTEHISTTVTTTCINIASHTNLYENLHIETDSRDAYITWTPICDGILKFKIEPIKYNLHDCASLTKGEITRKINEKNLNTTLIPNTEYNLTITVTYNGEKFISYKKFTTKEPEFPVLKSAPKVISTTLTSIKLRFDKNDIINWNLASEYLVQIKIGTNNWEIYNNTREKIQESNIYELKNLYMETNYNVRVVLYTEKNIYYDECIPVATTTTKCTDFSQHNLIQNLRVMANQYGTRVTWSPVCKNMFQVNVICNGDNWCRTPTENYKFNSIDRIGDIKNLVPYTNYILKFKVINSDKTEMENKSFRTTKAAPPPVTELQVYSFNSSGVSVRFKKPYPPHGELEKYETSIKPCPEEKITDSSPESCKFWNDFQCVTIPQNFDKPCQKHVSLSITAKNKGVDEDGNYTEIKFDTTKVTDAPDNLKINNETQDICWSHPNFVRGTLTEFQITAKQIETKLVIIPKTSSDVELYKVKSFNESYCFKFNLSLSSTYEIVVQAKNKIGELGHKVKRNLTTLPIKPQLFGNNITKGDRTNYTQKIIIPPIINATKTKNSKLHIVVCDPRKSTNQPKNNYNHQLILTSNCSGTLWQAAILNVSTTDIEFIVGDNNTSVDNKLLSPDVNYTINVILINEYKNQFSMERYSFVTTAPQLVQKKSPALFSLLLLLLIVPAIAYFIYKKLKKPLVIREPGTSFEEAAIPNNHFSARNLVNSLSRYMPTRKNNNVQTETEHELPLITENNFNNDVVYSQVVKISKLSQYVKESIEDGELKRQHALFPKGGTKPWDYGMAKENKFKNRYNNLTAYNHTRVILDKIAGDPFSDFINASYIDGYKQPKAYIATQGPKPTTLNDFWRMIWQENVRCIIMLANLEEGNKKKCEKYWPDIGSTRDFFRVSVTFVRSDVYADFEYRYFEVKCNNETRKIQQLHFTSWPDHGVPQYPQSLVPFLRKILTFPVSSPIVVHCSAGVGRTGTIILSDICLRMAAVEGQVDILKYLQSIREQRANLVDNYDQYKLVHMVLLECLLAPETSLRCDNLAEAVNELIEQDVLQKQMNYLTETAWHNQIMKSNLEMFTENISKNRFRNIIPTTRRIYISRFPFDDECSDYINAVPVDGFKTKDQFIVTQTPLPKTVQDFWRLVHENDVRVIVSLNEIIVNDETCCIFWPLEQGGQSKPVPHLTVTCQSVKEGQNYDVYNISVVHSSEENEVNVRLMQLKNWKREQIVPDDEEMLIGILEEAQSFSRQGSMVVTCYDGARACGLFVALSFLIEKIKLEQVCDVCQAVRTVRTNRPQFVSHRAQFEFLYSAAVHYVAQFETYSNFEGPKKI